MPIQDDIRAIATAESGEDVRGAIISAIQDLNTNGGNAQTLNGYNSDYFTKKAEFDKFVDDEVGQIHQVLDAINRGTTLKVLDLKTYTIGPEAGRLDITVPSSVKDRALLTVDDFYADIVSVSSGSGQNASWVKNASYDSAIGVYHYIYGAIASEITLHFYVKRASAIPVPDYDVHPLSGALTENRTYTADPGEAWSAVTVDVPTGGKTERTLTATENKTYRVPDDRTVWNEVVVAVPIPEPQLQVGSASITSDTFHRTFEPESGKDGFSSFTVDVNVDLNLDYQEIDVNSINFSERVLPRSGFNGLSEVRITSSLELEDPITVRQNGPVSLSYGKVGFSEVTVAVPVPVVETGRSVTYSSGGTYTVNPTGNNDAMDSVEVTVQTPRLQPSKSVTLSQSGTVTPDPGFDAMEEVVVTVSGGGGGDCNIMDKATWDALPFAEKKRSGLTVIKNSLTDLVGTWYDLTTATSEYLPYSRNIIGDASIDNFDATSHSWGGFTLSKTLIANADGIGVDIFGRPDAAQGHPDVEFVYCDLGDVNTDFTAYLVCRYSTDFAYSAIIGASYQESSGNCAYIIESGINNVAGVCGGSSVVGDAHTQNTYIVVAIRNSNKNISFFKNGVKGSDRTAYNVGRYVTLTTPYPNGTNYSTQITAAFAGVVAEAEPDSTVLENINHLMEKFNIS